ncbi:MAG: UDP-N-acetylmuramoyl-tripeptide--D-alanyl-D-alanine ligase [Tissierellia bacterium]|nr:UDP-N-acetylmuramoyl-tripeptide--D-alanyl-D-alanine ligase [Tissierellia bacterium]
METKTIFGFLLFLYYGLGAYITYRFIKKIATKPLHILQLEGYDNEEYKTWLDNNPEAKFGKIKESIQEKTPLVMTPRATRLYTKYMQTNAVILVILLGLSALFYHKIIWILLFPILLYLLYRTQFLVIIVANTIALPKEKKINHGFYVQAQEKIKSYPNLQVVGITGSFGKTSTKFITNTILSEKLKVQNTPSSYNTPMGLSKVINNDLDETKEVFIAELGAKVPGEIKEVADLVQPTIGVITAIGPTHMHLFKTIENIKKTKYELIEALPETGIAIFNYDNEHVKELADKAKIHKLLYGMEDVEKLDIYADNFTIGANGSTFRLHLPGKSPVICETKLLGKHNISNLLAAASIAHVLGMEPIEIANGIRKVEPVEHRLNLIKGPTGVLVIDDAFNSNPIGARAALEVLNTFKGGKKIIITPGMVELGDIEEEENYKLGKEIAKVCDYCILVGPKRTEPIQRGLKEVGYPEQSLFIAKSLQEATEISGHLTKAGDIILIENDLPDTYNEV